MITATAHSHTERASELVVSYPQLPAVPKVLSSLTSKCPVLSDHSVVFSSRIEQGGFCSRICERLGATQGKLLLGKFPNSETRIEIHESVRDRHAFVVSTMGNSVNDSLMETALMIQALKLADAKKITVILPYFPYSRQDRKADIRPPISAKAVTDILKVMGVHQILTVDLHATQVEGFFDGSFENLSGLNQMVPQLIKDQGDDVVIISPDAGGAKRAENFARQVEQLSGKFSPLIVMSKFRPGPDIAPVVTVSAGTEMLAGKVCVIVDDMIDTGGSIIAAAKALKDKGAARVIVCATHAVFSQNAIANLASARCTENSRAIDQIYVTDTLAFKNSAPELIKVISIAPLIAEAISRIDRPLGTLRDLKERTDLGEELHPNIFTSIEKGVC